MLLTSAGIQSRVTGLVLAATLFSGFAVVNTFYTWPKLFPAAYLILLAAILLTRPAASLRDSAWGGIVAGGLAGAALLGHEGSLLAIIALAAVVLAQRRVPCRNFLLAALAVVVVLQGSWLLYQKVYDPPGDQLARLLLANQPNLYAGDPRPLPTVVISAYKAKPLLTIVANKQSNLVTPFKGGAQYLEDFYRVAASYIRGSTRSRDLAVKNLRFISFFYLVPTLGFLGIGFLLWCAALTVGRRATPGLLLAGTIWIFLVANVASWALILFGPSATVLHQGTYLTVLLAFVGAVVSIWEWSPVLATALVILQTVLFAIAYGFTGPLTTPHVAVYTPSVHLAMVAVVVASATLTLVALAAISMDLSIARGSWKLSSQRHRDQVG
jgi:hypothetical protein